MGTRADFYVGRNEEAEWLGSIAWDGYREGVPATILGATTEAEYRAAVETFFAGREDATRPEQGWPWPWESSWLTDCSYWFDEGKVWDKQDKRYVPCATPLEGLRDEDGDFKGEGFDPIRFPDMTARKNVTLGARSGIMLFTEK